MGVENTRKQYAQSHAQECTKKTIDLQTSDEQRKVCVYFCTPHSVVSTQVCVCSARVCVRLCVNVEGGRKRAGLFW